MFRPIILLSFILFGWTDGQRSTRTISAFAKYQWSSMNYVYPNETARQQAIDKKLFIPGAAIPIDFHHHYHKTVGARRFITTPRSVPGVPATIGYLPNDDTTYIFNPSIIPYPNWEMNTIDGNCTHIISVHRIQIDDCNRLWIIDTGINENFPICPPKILIYNLLTDQLIRIYEFDVKKLLIGTKLMTTIIELSRNQCEHAHAFIADPERYQLIVYSYKTNSSWAIRNEHLNPNPHYGILTINGTNYDAMSGISGMVLGLTDLCGNRELYFHNLGSVEQKHIPTVVPKSMDMDNNYGASAGRFRTSSIETSQSSSMAINKLGVIFFISLSDSTLKCWDTSPMAMRNGFDTIHEVINTRYEYPTSLQIETDANGVEKLVGLFITPQSMFHGTVNPDEDSNFSLKYWEVNTLINTTRCDRLHPFNVLPQYINNDTDYYEYLFQIQRNKRLSTIFPSTTTSSSVSEKI